MNVDNKFFDWLNIELAQRGWSYRELGKRAGFSSGTVSMVINGKNKISWEFCAGVALAFKVPAEPIFRLAGLLPLLPAPASDPILQEILEVTKQLDANDREELLAYAKLRYQRAHRHK